MGRRERKNKKHVEIIRKSQGISRTPPSAWSSLPHATWFFTESAQSHKAQLDRCKWHLEHEPTSGEVPYHGLRYADSQLYTNQANMILSHGSFWRNHYQISFGLILFSWCLIFTHYGKLLSLLWPLSSSASSSSPSFWTTPELPDASGTSTRAPPANDIRPGSVTFEDHPWWENMRKHQWYHVKIDCKHVSLQTQRPNSSKFFSPKALSSFRKHNHWIII